MSKKGFTLIELLVVIVIIGILATISVATFSGYFKKARDAERKVAIQTISRIMKTINASKEDVDYSIAIINKKENNDNNNTFAIISTVFAGPMPPPGLWGYGPNPFPQREDLDNILKTQGYTTPDSKNGYKYLYAYNNDKNEFAIAVCLEDSTTNEFIVDGTPNGIRLVNKGAAGTGCDDPNSPTPITTLDIKMTW